MKRITIVLLFVCAALFAEVQSPPAAGNNSSDADYDEFTSAKGLVVRIPKEDTGAGKDGTVVSYRGKETTLAIEKREDNLYDIGSIGEGAFRNLDRKLKAITLPASITEIGPYAFEGNELTNMQIPDRIYEIKPGAFRNNRLSAVSFPSNLEKISENAFENNKFTRITIPPDITIGGRAFAGNAITSIAIGENVNMENSSFDNNFARFYQNGGMKAGHYVLRDGTWMDQTSANDAEIYRLLEEERKAQQELSDQINAELARQARFQEQLKEEQALAAQVRDSMQPYPWNSLYKDVELGVIVGVGFTMAYGQDYGFDVLGLMAQFGMGFATDAFGLNIVTEADFGLTVDAEEDFMCNLRLGVEGYYKKFGVGFFAGDSVVNLMNMMDDNTDSYKNIITTRFSLFYTFDRHKFFKLSLFMDVPFVYKAYSTTGYNDYTGLYETHSGPNPGFYMGSGSPWKAGFIIALNVNTSNL
ncbi:MAG: leucine-rich repeat domain-containing protein [Treponema sp.]|jgi:hypothetical protein|nr:leucine-rich repeat domain-containing protein [Treponema sp.]